MTDGGAIGIHLSPEFKAVIRGQAEDFRTARDASAALAAKLSLPELRRRACLRAFCPCNRLIAFVVWVGDRPLLWYSSGRRDTDTYMWLDMDFWGTRASCPRCGRELEIFTDLWREFAVTSRTRGIRLNLQEVDMEGPD